MPVLSSFISYRPKRKAKAARSPFPIRQSNSSSSPHPYASPHVLDINDGGALAPSRKTPVDAQRYNTTDVSDSPRVKLDIELNPQPLTDWFPTNLLESDPFTVPLDRQSTTAGGSGTSNDKGRPAVEPAGTDRNSKENDNSIEDDEGDDVEEETSSSSEDVLAHLEAMDASSFVGPGDVLQRNGYPQVTSWKKSAPTPIKIPNMALHGTKMQVVRSADPSRPTSLVSSSESSAVSGTTLARALMANTFVLSGDPRASRYRSGTSTLTRQDSATLPRGEYSLIHSPYWRDRTISSGDPSLSPDSAPMPFVPPVPVNAELVYVPPKATRRGADARGALPAHDRSGTGSIHSEEKESAIYSRTSTPPPENEAFNAGEDMQELRRISRITEATSSFPPTPARSDIDHRASVEEEGKSPSRRSTPHGSVDLEVPHRTLTRPDSDTCSIAPPGQSPLPDPPSSAKDIDNVLDYYSFADTPEPSDRNFRPVFSPITEESSSQLSPPTPYRPDRRDSKRTLSSGRFFLGTSPSPSSAGGRVDWDLSRRSSDSRPSSGIRDSSLKYPLLPIGERPRSIQLSPPPSSSLHPSPHHNFTSTSFSAAASELHGGLLPPPASTIFNRQRSGSAPSPIKVVRDSHDYTAYSFTVAPRPDDSTGSSPTTGDSDMARQTFPETPSAFSPALSPSFITSPGLQHGDTQYPISMAVPQTPMSAFLPGNGVQPNLAQQVLLTRAATSVQGARYSRQAGRLMHTTLHPYARPTSAVLPPREEPAVGPLDKIIPPAIGTVEAPAEGLDMISESFSTAATQPSSNRKRSTTDEQTMPIEPITSVESVALTDPSPPVELTVLAKRKLAHPEPPSAHSLSSYGSGPSGESMSVYGGVEIISSRSPSLNSLPMSRATTTTNASGSHTGLTDSPQTKTKTLPRIPPIPSMPPPSPPQQDHSMVPPDQPAPTIPSVGTTITHNHLAQPIQAPTPDLTPATTSAGPSSRAITASRPMMATPPPAQASSSLLSTYEPALGSPPPYYAVVRSDRMGGEAMTPSTGGSYDPSIQFAPYPPQTPSSNNGESSGDRPPSTGQSSIHRRARVRPPLPAGPRRPSQQHGMGLAGMRERGGSVSSIVSSGLPSGTGRRLNSTVLPSPKFQTPPVKWRGYTMDAAKWTFTSAQLQGIVSRAIRQSAEASSIRLLRLETLDNDIPEEIHRLETDRTDAKMKYKMLARRRANLLESLSAHIDGQDQENPARLIDELKDVSTTLDKLAEDLHSLDQQLAQLALLCQTHSASALAMALRKLNASFLKQFAESQTLRKQVETLAAERDEAWKHAEDTANAYDALSVKGEHLHVENRFSRVAAVRKSSLRASKAGLRSTSQRSSVASAHRTVPSAGVGNTFHLEDVPPVPPIPRHRPQDIVTDLPSRSSIGISTSGPTPTSAMRAMVRAQEELYDMLGITVTDTRSRRSRSVIGLPSDSEPSQQATSPTLHPHSEPSNIGRRASLPGNSGQPDAYKALTADVSIILTADRGWI